MSAQVNVLVAADRRLVREWLTRDLSSAPDIVVVGAASKHAELVCLARCSNPDLLVLDRGMPDGLLAVREILAQTPRVRVLAFGVQETEAEVAVCADAGVHGFIPRDASRAVLPVCVRRAMRGEFVGSSAVSALLLQHAARRTGPSSDRSLTGREVQVMRLIELGRSNKEIARAAGIEVATVKNHVHRLLLKLQVHRRTEAVAKWRQCGHGTNTGWEPRRSS